MVGWVWEEDTLERKLGHKVLKEGDTGDIPGVDISIASYKHLEVFMLCEKFIKTGVKSSQSRDKLYLLARCWEVDSKVGR